MMIRLTGWLRQARGIALLISGLTAGLAPQSQAVTRNWTGGVDSDWFNSGNWSDSTVPGADEEVIVTNTARSILLTNATANLAGFTMTNNSLMFSNWYSCLTASNVTIRNQGILILPVAFTNAQMSNRVWIVCSNLTIDAGGTVNADGKGYSGGDNAQINGYGPGGGSAGGNAAYGGGYGGQGGGAGGGQPYGSTNAPIHPGSGGGRPVWTGPGGNGGGAVRIEAGGTVTVCGTITANGGSGGASAGGSGGGIFITCDRLDGTTNGLIRANGGDGQNGGGGGRIAVVYNAASQTANPGIRFATASGTPGATAYYGDGTLHLTNAFFLSEILANRLFWKVVLCIPGMTNWAGNNLAMSDCWFTFQPTNFMLAVTNCMAVTNGGMGLTPGTTLACGDMTLNNSTLLAYKPGAIVCGNDLLITNAAKMYIYSGVTNVATADYGALVCATGNMTLAAGCWIYPYSDNTNGGSVLFRMGNLTIAANAGFDADTKGFRGGDDYQIQGYGPGGGFAVGNLACGGGYGGQGSGSGGGQPYGSTNAPIHPGSGGGRPVWTGPGGNGGGAVRIEAGGTVTVRGTITANGGSGGASAGGSGGGIFITCDRLDGTTNGLISANGGDGQNGGSGGRIAVVYNAASQTVNPGIRFATAPGTPSAIAYFGDGTLYLTNALFLSETLANRLFWKVVLYFPQAMTNWAGDRLVVSDCWFTFPSAGFSLAFTNQVALTNGGLGLTPGTTLACRDMTLNNSTLLAYKPSAVVCGNDLLITNAAKIYIYSGVTNAATADYGALVCATGNITLASGCWIYPYSDDTNGGSVLFRMNNLAMATNAGFNADAKGFKGGDASHYEGYGPGAGKLLDSNNGHGGGYGGRGAGSLGGQPYGSTNTPIHPGSGGARLSWDSPGGNGGGSIRIEAAGALTVNGAITANGGVAGSACGGGSGGGIFMICSQISGTTNGLISANGSNGNYGGGGGRIAIWIGVPQSLMAEYLAGNTNKAFRLSTNVFFTGTTSVTNGSGGAPAAEVGTAWFFTRPTVQGTMITIN